MSFLTEFDRPLTTDWISIGEGDETSEFYRKIELYDMEWTSQVDIENYAVVGASYGGPVAIIKDDKKFLRVTAQIPVKPIISIFTAAGRLISSLKWDSGILVRMGWSSSEDLLCVQEDGNILVYNLFGASKETVQCLIGSESKEKAFEAEIFPSNNGTGVAYLTTKGNFVVVNNYRNARATKFAQVPFSEIKITSWTVVAANRLTNIVAARETSVYRVDATQAEQVFPEFVSVAGMNSAISFMAASLNGVHIALLTESGILWMGSSDFSKKYCEHTLGLRTKPKQMVWCGSKAVVISWDTTLVLVNLAGESISFSMDSQFALIPEIDCVRVVGNTTHEIIQKVPRETNSVFGIGSVEPGSVLFLASNEYAKGSHKADEYIRTISNMNKAVEECISAAGHEFYPPTQKLLLKAAQFGKCFLTKYNPEGFVHMCQMLRILNAVKDYKIAIPLTYTQLEKLTIPVLIDRLVLRRQYSLAIKIAEFLKLRESQGRSRILAHWACYKVGQTHIEEGKLADEIYEKLKSDTNISYSEIANKAFESGRKKLALKLARFEVRRSIQVPLLLQLGDKDTALHNAVESGDANLIYDVLLSLRDSMPLGQFQMLIRKYPMAQKLYIKYCKIFKPESVRDIYDQEDDFESQAALFIKESYSSQSESKFAARLSSLVSAQEMYKKSKNEFMASVCEEQVKLLKYQQTLQQQYGKDFIDLSLRDTIKELLSMKELKLAEKLRSEFKVSEKMFWSIRLQTLGEHHEWPEVEKLSKTKKVPGGFEEFVEVCLQYGNRAEAHKYLPRVKEDLQVKYYVMARYFEEAADIAYERKNENELLFIRSSCIMSDRSLAEKIEGMVTQLRTAPPDRGNRNARK
ncbi:Vacuolar protein sorting-associated protein 16 [Orchesella cincta]|uniref:Vacuolar protein sorting-associated protein 16 homolog n=1 Tax=Orchesella cincta TaxID=48709 RepID=A0A1D2MTX4_ORCCI|nr:Vacuolar protein sorting-associated protein 16 [Orchesella cincta]